MANKNKLYVALLTHWKHDIILHSEQLKAALLLALECRALLNGGTFDNGRDLLTDSRLYALIGLDAQDADMVRNAPSPFWHWEGSALVIDLYSQEHEQRIVDATRRAKRAALASAIVRSTKYQQEIAQAEHKLSNRKEEKEKNRIEKKEREPLPSGGLPESTPPARSGGSKEEATPTAPSAPPGEEEAAAGADWRQTSRQEAAAYAQQLYEMLCAADAELPQPTGGGSAHAH